jgi:cell fate regulator YaaT (PSP1 superfamily)
MPTIVGVRFRPVAKIYYFDPSSQQQLALNDYVIVETSRGAELGSIAIPPRSVSKNDIKGKLKRILRRATPVDLLEAQEYRAKEPAVLTQTNELAKKMGLSMKIIEAEYNFDGTRLLLSFISEQRIDFRELVKELSQSLKTRIEMKQVGARDETKILDGYGRCGRQLCCSSWLTEFHPVSIRMAKQQDLPLAPAEISGVCGRLLCCLAYENDLYTEIKKKLPKVGTQVKTKQGVATVRGLNIITETVIVQLDENEAPFELQATEVTPIKKEEATPPRTDPV